jgi:hypothetical protein
MTWTTLLATQIALSIAILPSAIEMTWGIFRPMIMGPGLPVEQFLTASLAMEGDTSSFETLASDVVRRLASQPGISGVTTSAAALLREPVRQIEVDGIDASDVDAEFEVDADVNSVDRAYFQVFGVRFLAGRGFEAGEFGKGSASVIVNRTFVVENIGGGPALGRRVRYLPRDENGRPAPLSPWSVIVGVVDDFPANNERPVMYYPMASPSHPLRLTIRAPSGAGVAAERLRAVSARLDSRLRVGDVESLRESYWNWQSVGHTFGVLVATITAVVMLFSMAGIYTLTAFIVAQRRREIGVRSALGAAPGRLLMGIFGRSAVPLVIGAIAGSVLAVALNSALPIADVGGQRIPGVVPAAAALMVLVGVLAVAGPARRAIGISLTETLRVG